MRYDERILRHTVAMAVRAPSQHNSQPWLFRLNDGGIEVIVDEGRLGAGPGTGWATRLSCGAAIFNLRLALTVVTGHLPEVKLRPYAGEPAVLARLTPGAPHTPTPAERGLFEAIPRRFSNRAPFWPTPVTAAQRWRLVEAARTEAAWLELIIGPAAVEAVAAIAQSADHALARDPRYAEELRRWTRATDAPDGIPLSAAASVPEPHDLLPQRPFGDRPRAPGRDYEPEPLVAVLGTHDDTDIDRIIAGMALQRSLLTAADAGLAVSMISQPIEVPAARERLRTALGRYGTPQMVMRVGYGQPGWPTPRRPIEDVIVVRSCAT